MSDESYYRALAVVDRVNEIVREKTYDAEFSRKMGYNPVWWGVVKYSGRSLSLKNILKAAEVLDVSVEYLLSGKNKQPYKPKVIDFSVLITKYKELAREAKRLNEAKTGAPTNAVKICNTIKRGWGFYLKSVYDYSDILKIEPSELVFRDI